MSRLGRRRLPVVIAPVDVLHWRIRELDRINIIEYSQIHGIELAAGVWHICVTERADPASSAKEVMDAPKTELVVRELGFAGEQPKRVGADRGEP
jgi:hypothetical protein